MQRESTVDSQALVEIDKGQNLSISQAEAKDLCFRRRQGAVNLRLVGALVVAQVVPLVMKSTNSAACWQVSVPVVPGAGQ